MKNKLHTAALCALLLAVPVLPAIAQDPVPTHTAVISTTVGDISVELYGRDAPKTVANFVELARRKYYNGIAFHRCVPGFVIQGGDPASRDTALRAIWGEGGESIYGKTFADELDSSAPSVIRGYREGVLAMANSGPNTNGSQFFINVKDNSRLPKLYSIFGKVTAGMDVVHRIEATGAPDNKPEHPALITGVSVKELKGGKKTPVIQPSITHKRKNVNPNDPIVTSTAVISTSLGDITVELYGNDAPKTVANFVGLAKNKFYEGILFHRIVRGFVIQAGDPKTKDASLRQMWGTGGESIYGGPFEDELNPAAPSYQRGYVAGALAMANAGPNTNSSQFFIMLADLGLQKAYTIFGRVTAGMDVAHKIESMPLEIESPQGGMTKTPVIINSITVK